MYIERDRPNLFRSLAEEVFLLLFSLLYLIMRSFFPIFDHFSHNLTTMKGLAEAHEKSHNACLTAFHDLKRKSEGEK